MNESDFMITEEAPGYFNYHISYKISFIEPICGKPVITMHTEIPMNTWGFVGHLNERYCEQCKELYDEKCR